MNGPIRIYVWTLLLTLALYPWYSSAQMQNTYVQPDQMRRDIDHYFNDVRQVNPVSYAHYSARQFDSVRLVLKDMCSTPKAIMQFVYTMALANKLTDENSGIKYLTDNSREILFTSKIDFRDGTLWTDGKRIDRINGIDARQLFAVTDGLVSWTFGDGERQRRMKMLFPYAAAVQFSLMLPYQCEVTDVGTGQKSRVTIEYETFRSTVDFKIATDKSFDPSHHVSAVSQRFFDKESAAIFYYNTSDPSRAETIRVQADEFFRKVAEKGIRNVFIDVSQNGGGSDEVNRYVLRHLTSRGYDYSIKYEVAPGALAVVDSMWRGDPNRNAMVQRYREVIAGRNVSKYHMAANEGYKGRVFVIMGASTFSAAADFCDQVKRGGAGTLVGEPAGQRMPYSGNAVTMRLPGTNLPFDCSTQRFTTLPSMTDQDGFLRPDMEYGMNRRMGIQDYLKIITMAK